jgi:glycosyltransferase involved in cell wall biosynthesis
MAIGVPVIGTYAAGIAEVVEHGTTGLLVQPASPAALAGAIRWSIENPLARDSMGAAARHVVHARFDAQTQSQHLEDALLQVMGRI